MKALLITLGLIALVWANVGLAMSSDDPSDWIDKMVSAKRLQTYQGTFVYTRGKEMTSMKVFHRFKDGWEEERLIALDGKPREIIRKGERVLCHFPGNETVELEQALPGNPFQLNGGSIAPLKSVYSINLAGMERLAGFEVVKVAVMAKDHFRYSYLLWLEKNSGLLVKSIMTGTNGEVLEHFQFTSLQIGGVISDSDIKPKMAFEGKFHSPAPNFINEEGVSPLPHHWQLKWLPEGFKPAKYISKRNSIMPQDSRTRVYSDGLAMFSVFVEYRDVAGIPEGASKTGATSAFSRYITIGNREYVVTVVGEVPVTTARQVALSAVMKKKG